MKKLIALFAIVASISTNAATLYYTDRPELEVKELKYFITTEPSYGIGALEKIYLTNDSAWGVRADTKWYITDDPTYKSYASKKIFVTSDPMDVLNAQPLVMTNKKDEKNKALASIMITTDSVNAIGAKKYYVTRDASWGVGATRRVFYTSDFVQGMSATTKVYLSARQEDKVGADLIVYVNIPAIFIRNVKQMNLSDLMTRAIFMDWLSLF